MRFIGGKSNLLPEIESVIQEKSAGFCNLIDIFSGSGSVTTYLKTKGYNVIANDIMYFAYVLLRGSAGLSCEPNFRSLDIEDPIKYLNDIRLEDSGLNIEECFIYQNYTPHDDINRMYFQPKNAKKIDAIRLTIENWHRAGQISEDEYYYLLASLIAAVPYVSNITGVYGAYLKHWDKRTYNDLRLEKPEIIKTGHVYVYNENSNSLLPRIEGDILYADPPYNTRQYLPNYHILETVARYDYPEIHGVTGMRDYENQKSDFCSKAKVETAFRNLIENARVKHILISYNSEGLLSTEILTSICEDYAKSGTFELKEIDYRRYNNAGTKPGGVTEQLYYFQKR